MSFWGCSIKPGQTHKLGSLPDAADILHLSQVCLHEPKPGKNYVRVEVDGKTFTIAKLEIDKQEHDSVDLFFGPGQTVFSNKGASEVHLLGYIEPKDDDDSAPEAVTASASSKKASPAIAPAKSPVQAAKKSPVVAPTAGTVATKTASPAMSPKANPKAKNSPGLIPEPKVAVAKKQAEEESDEDDMEDEEGEEEEPLEDDELIEEGEEGEEEEDAEEDEEESEEQAAKGKASKKAAPEKRKAAEVAKPDASPAKKAKEAPKEPKEVWADLLHKYLKDHGKTSVAQLGSKVQKPNKDLKIKLSALLKEKPDKFKVNGDQVTAA